MDQIKSIVGVERSLEGVCQAIHLSAVERSASTVGAMHITCSDESEHECVSAFQKGFINFMLPSLKFAQQAGFRIANLGARYDWAAVRIAEQHYAAAARPGAVKLLVVKVNSHVGVIDTNTGPGPRYGVMKRYDGESFCCGALYGLMSGEKAPYAERLTDVFVSEGQDRLSTLLDETKVDPKYRALDAAIVNARLQARKVMLDIQDYTPTSPTEYLVMPCVTINRTEKDTEIVCGFYFASSDDKAAEYCGLGDDPAGYEHVLKNGRLTVSDGQVGTCREARNHRQLALEQWHLLMRGRTVQIQDERLDRVRRETAGHTGPRHVRVKQMLPVLLAVLAEVDPVSAAVLLFGNGCGGIHNAFHVHRLARQLEGSDQARRILAEISDRVDQLDPSQAEAIMELLTREYRA